MYGTKTVNDIHTGVYDDEAAALVRYATGKRVLELGAWQGFSTVVMAQVAKSVLTCDWFQGDDHAGNIDTLEIFMRNITRYKVRDKVQMLVGRFEDTMGLLDPGWWDFAFIDGFHDAESTTRDLSNVSDLMPHIGDIIAVHDYNRTLNPGTKSEVRFEVDDAVGWWMRNAPQWEEVELVNSLYVIRRCDFD